MRDRQRTNGTEPQLHRDSRLPARTCSDFVGGAERISRLLPEPLLELVGDLHRRFSPAHVRLLADRGRRQVGYDSGRLPGYLDADSIPVMPHDWTVAPLPPDLLRRRVEITGPVSDLKMVINMLSRSKDGVRADAAMLDFEDSMKPTWQNVLAGLENLKGAADGTLRLTAKGKEYSLDPADMPLFMVRVRGLHLDEWNVTVDGTPVSAGLFDLVASAYHTVSSLLEAGRTPMYYVPKCEHHLEARWWNELFAALEEGLGLQRGTLRVTFLIETLPAAFQMEEILFEIRERAAALNVGRWDKIFSDIKVLKEHPDRVMPDRSTVTMESPWMKNYALSLIRICHKRGAFAIGGMAAFTPGRLPEQRAHQTALVASDKRFEASLGHDGCWVSHPYFIECALSAFEEENQLHVIPQIGARPDLLPRGGGQKTLDGLRKNIRVGIAYLKGWNEGYGCIAWDDLMEDLATLEISRAQVWQWLRHAARLDDGTVVTLELIAQIFREEMDRIERSLSETAPRLANGSVHREVERFRRAAEQAEVIFTETDLRPFLNPVRDSGFTPAPGPSSRAGSCSRAGGRSRLIHIPGETS